MNIYLVSQSVNDDCDTFDSFVCLAENESEARRMSPNDQPDADVNGCFLTNWGDVSYSWAPHIEHVSVVLIGAATEATKRVVCASFNAG